MPQGVFITGGTGFVGRRLLAAAPAFERPVFALVRRATPHVGAPGVSIVRGDLLRPESYRDILPSCDTVLHLAAATGRATAADHERVNAHGTELLVEECRRAGVKNLLFVSSVAATFPDKTGYHYALAKTRAEEAVRRSGLRFLILRPTMILGPDSPILAALAGLATLPVAVLPGNGRARVQPIHVDDVVSCLLAAVRLDAFGDDEFIIAGRQTTSMEDLVRRVRLARRGARGPLVRVPLLLLRTPLRMAEASGLGRVLPLTAGQLASFRFDGIGSPNPLQESAELVDLDQMITPPRAAEKRESLLDAECSLFTRHLLGRDASEYVCLKYSAAHTALSTLSSANRFDSFLVRFARMGPRCANVADAHAAVFAPSSLLRKKLVVLLAILETSWPYCELIDAPLGGGRPTPAVAALAYVGVGAVVALAISVPILLPVRLILAALPKAER